MTISRCGRYKGRHPSGDALAVKRLSTEQHQDLNQFETEARILQRTRHRCIVLLMGYCRDGPAPCLVYEFMEAGNLGERLLCKEGTPPLTELQRVSCLSDVLEGLAYIHAHEKVSRASDRFT